ncbi:EamA family transporter [Virgibacillus profundi]|uniref:EamA family transporter n=1 Tax=Virgibacillus profundi TaxID=2024555 RepID=A0A2A2IBV6_9BACI|nr:DMT family transporter [Virgibacillus profundi]PAV28625.1 EamA family transporter [Virgibacillus profundi]PXY52793.1 EamA family transporter [Virgibacillus profundi]
MKGGYFKYIAALILFGSNGIVASYILLNSYEIVYLRTLIGSIFLIIVFALSKQKVQFWKNKSHFLFLVISGVAMGVSWILLYEAFAQIGVSIATLAYYCGPVIVMVLSPFIFKEKMTGGKLLGFLAVIIGMLFVNGQALSQEGTSWGLIFGILSAFMYAIMVIFNKKAKSITGLENAMCQLTMSFITVAIFIGLKQGFSVNITQGNLIPVLLLGIVCTGMGCYFYFSSIGGLPVQTVSILGYLEPFSALIFSAAILGEKLSLVQIVGAVLILGGAAIGELYRSRKNKLREEEVKMVL